MMEAECTQLSLKLDTSQVDNRVLGGRRLRKIVTIQNKFGFNRIKYIVQTVLEISYFKRTIVNVRCSDCLKPII